MPELMGDERVRLNVGGVEYRTTRATLLQYPSSMLGAMFSGNLPSTPDPDGSYFIDRDGHLFSYVLNFLRSSKLSLPDDFKQLDALSVEADFYQVEPLIKAVGELRGRDSVVRGRLLEVVELRTGTPATMPTNNSRVKTILIARNDTISSLPQNLIERVREDTLGGGQADFSEVSLSGSNARLKVGEYLQEHGWLLQHSNLSSSSGYDNKAMFSSLVVEQTYRDRWLLPDSSQTGS